MHRRTLCGLALLVGLLPTTCLGLSQDDGATLPQGSTANSGPTVGLAPGTRAPEFTLESVNGETVRLSDFRGQTILIHFWATWCGPCKITMPWLVDLQNKYAARGFHVIAISLDDNTTKVEIGEFVDGLHVNFPVLIGNERVAEAYGGIPAMPVSFLVSQDGRLVETVVGIASKSELEKSVRKALNTPRAEAGAASVSSQPQN